MSSSPKVTWSDGEAYEAYIGRWGRVAAVEFLQWLDVSASSTWLDVGCGTGALTQAILQGYAPARIDAFDLSPPFIEIARRTTPDARASFSLGDACALPCASDEYDACVSALMLNIVPDQRKAISELVRAAKPSAVVGLYVWDFDGEMQILRYFWESANALDPNADRDRDQSGFAICKPDRLAQALRDAGLQDVAVRAIDVPAHFRDFEDYWMPFTRGGAPAQTHVASLRDDLRAALRDRIRTSLPIGADGSIPLIARAWAAKGRRRSSVA